MPRFTNEAELQSMIANDPACLKLPGGASCGLVLVKSEARFRDGTLRISSLSMRRAAS